MDNSQLMKLIFFCGIIYGYRVVAIWNMEQRTEKVARARLALFWPFFLIKYMFRVTFWGTGSFCLLV